MLIRIEENRFGHLEVEPVNVVTSVQLRKELNAGRPKGSKLPLKDSLCYLQCDTEINSFLESLSPRARQELKAVRWARARMDITEVRAYAGLSPYGD